MEYDFMPYISYKEMTKEQTKETFKWYVSEIPHRIEILKDYANNKCKAGIDFNYEVSSLTLLWKWFEEIIEIEDMEQWEIDRELKIHPDWMHDIILSETKRPSLQTIAIAKDIAIYFAEVFRKNNQDIYWTYLTGSKRSPSLNKPILKGFAGKGDYLDPSNNVLICVQKSRDNKNPNMLEEMYNVWSKAVGTNK